MGIKKASGDYILIQDADMEYFPKDIPLLIGPILEYQVPVVYGSRLMKNYHKISPMRLFGNKILTWITNLLFQSHLTDMETGYKVIRTELLKKISITSRDFEIEPEITAKIMMQGVSIVELPIHYNFRKKGQSKFNIADGLEAFFILLQCRYYSTSLVFQWIYGVFVRLWKPIFKKIFRSFLH